MTDFQVINIIDIDEEKLISSNITEDDYPEWSDVVTYARGTFVISTATHTVYRSLTDSNLDNDPDQEAIALADPLIENPDPINWQIIGATNLYRAFDGKPSVRSTNDDEITFKIAPGQLVQGIGVFEINALTVNINLTDPVLPRRNKITYSEQFNNADWDKLGGTITENVAIAPDGQTTADRFIEDSANSEHYIDRSFDVVNGEIYVWSTHVKDISADRNFRLITAGSAGANSIDFDPLTGLISTSEDNSIISSDVELLDDGSVRLWIIGTATGTGTGFFRQQLITSAGAPVYLGDGISGFTAWGAQLEDNELTDYQWITDASTWDKRVYNRDIQMQDETEIIDGFTYFFTPIIQFTEFILTDIPPYFGGEVEFNFSRPGAVVSVGQIAMGEIWKLGKSVIEGSGFTGLDFSFIDVDEFGNLTTAVRPSTEKHDFEVWVDNVTLGSFKRRMKSLRGGRGAVWISTNDTRLAAFSYGFALSYRNVYTTRRQSMISIEVQGKV